MKKSLAMLLAVCLMLSLCACGAGQSGTAVPQGEDPSVTQKTTVVHSIAMDNTTFDPMQSMNVGCLINAQVFECLIREETDGSLAPGLAESWELADDNLSITFKLREGVKFHNGETMTAEDVAFSLNRTIESHSVDSTTCMDHAEVVDDTHVILYLNSVYSDILNAMAIINMGIVPKSEVEAKVDAFGMQPVGTGPYTLESWTTGASMILAAFPDYWRGEAAIKEVTLLIQPDPSTGAIALESGEVDSLNAVLASDYQHLKDTEGVTVYDRSSVSTYTVYMQTQTGILADVRVRQAIQLCVNREDYVIGVMNGLGEAASTIIAPSMPYHNDSIEAPARDVEKAKMLLAEAGYPDGISIKFATVAETPDLVQIGNILQGQLAEAGIDMEIDIKELSAWINDVGMNHDFDITAAATTTNASVPGAVLSNILNPGAINNLGLYDNPEVASLLRAADETFDDSVKQECYDKVCQIVLEDCPYIAIATGLNMIAANSELKGVACPAVTALYFYDWSW